MLVVAGALQRGLMAAAVLSGLCLGACDVDATHQYDVVLAELTNKNYTYSAAVMRVKDIQSFGANSGNPYLVYDEMPEQKTLLGVPYWEMRPADAVLFIGCTPPAAKYFSWRSYLFRGGGDRLVFASMGDSSNNLVVHTQGSSAADARFALVTTGDATTYADVSSALDIAGLGSATNLDQVELTLFDGESAYYTMLHRASVWDNSTAREECACLPSSMQPLPATHPTLHQPPRFCLSCHASLRRHLSTVHPTCAQTSSATALSTTSAHHLHEPLTRCRYRSYVREARATGSLTCLGWLTRGQHSRRRWWHALPHCTDG